MDTEIPFSPRYIFPPINSASHRNFPTMKITTFSEVSRMEIANITSNFPLLFHLREEKYVLSSFSLSLLLIPYSFKKFISHPVSNEERKKKRKRFDPIPTIFFPFTLFSKTCRGLKKEFFNTRDEHTFPFSLKRSFEHPALKNH